MGWSWALWLANEAVCFAVAGRIERPLGEIRDRLPAPSFDKGVVTGVYVDNISIIGESSEAVASAAEAIAHQFQSDGIPLVWSAKQPQSVLSTVGVIFDFDQGVARNRPDRVWRTFLGGKELLRRRRFAIKTVEVWLGHATSLFMLAPAGLSCFFHIYRFIQQHRGKRAEVWKEVREEIKLALGMIWLSRCNLLFDPILQVDAGDASTSGYALMTTLASPTEIGDGCRFRETWRFRPLPESLETAARSGTQSAVEDVLKELHAEPTGPIMEEMKPSQQFGAGLVTQFATWLVESQDKQSWLRTSAVSSQLKAAPSKRIVVDLPALVCPLEDRLCRPERYSLLWRKSWRNREEK